MVRRYVKRGTKKYGPYHYKSKRVGKKVKSIYVGKEVKGKVKRKKSKTSIRKTPIYKFKLLVRKANTALENNRVVAAMDIYTEMTLIYSKLKTEEEKLKCYDEAKKIYDGIKLLNSQSF